MLKFLQKNIQKLLLILLFIGLFIFYSRLVPIVPFDTDDWCYMGYYRLPIPIWGDWNPSRVLPEVMMPYVSIFAARVIYPLTGDYIGSITWMYAFVVTAFISILCVQLYHLAESLGTSKTVAILLTILWGLLHFALLAGNAAGNTWLWGSTTATNYFYYAIPALLNEAIIIYLIRKKGTALSLPAKILLCILCYFGVFSNLFPAVILPAYAGIDILFSFWKWLSAPKDKKSSFLKLIRNEWLNLYICILFLVSAIFEMSGGRAEDFSGYKFKEVADSLQLVVKNANKWSLMSLLILVACSLIIVFKKGNSKSVNRERISTVVAYVGSFLVVLVFDILLCARTCAWYIQRQDVLIGIVFYVLLALFSLTCWMFTVSLRKKLNYVVWIVCILLNVLVFGKYNRNFYQPTNTLGISPDICRQIDEDILCQITDEVSAKKNQMDLHVPQFTNADNWPIATYAGGPYGRFSYTLWRHGIIKKSINITVVPDQAKNTEYGVW